jgi:hypothetical protein
MGDKMVKVKQKSLKQHFSVSGKRYFEAATHAHDNLALATRLSVRVGVSIRIGIGLSSVRTR